MTPVGKGKDSVARGVKPAVRINLAVLAILVVLSLLQRDFMWVFAIGILQLLYLPVVALHVRQQGRPQAAKGVWIVVGVTFLLSAATCTGTILVSLATTPH